MGYGGRCACGAITLHLAGEVLGTAQCWCRQCQRSAAGGGSNNAVFMTDTVHVNGSPGTWSSTSATGNTVTRSFCADCGTHVFGLNSAVPHLIAVSFGVIDQPHDLVPQKVIWAEEAPAWAVLDPAIEHMARQTPGERA